MGTRLTIDDARRIAVRAQLLDAQRPTDLLHVVDRLTMLQLDPTTAIAPNADLVAYTRLGSIYRPEHLVQAVERDRTLFEHRGQVVETEPIVVNVRPMASLPLHLADMAEWSTGWLKSREWMAANEGFRRRVLNQLRAEGPLLSRDIPDTAEVGWQSTGWTHDRNVTQMLEFLTSRGEVAVTGRRGRDRVWDLAERVFPADLVALPATEARRLRNERWLRALGVARPQAVGDAGVPVQIEGTVGEWRLDPAASADDFTGRTALLSPFDRLVHDRSRALDLFGFEYTLEMYKPAAKRRWGYFALPVLHHERLVGKLDATVDKKVKTLTVNAIHQDVRFTKAMTTAVDAEIDALAEWLGLADVRRS
ncbi:MAG: crosslink repair DNA glycosylase YcaQ family protein [Actinomycetota bacterium]|nr:crosslink repair DNA glycosylase YcaQ family protein [Actinomycetota bacterium]